MLDGTASKMLQAQQSIAQSMKDIAKTQKAMLDTIVEIGRILKESIETPGIEIQESVKNADGTTTVTYKDSDDWDHNKVSYLTEHANQPMIDFSDPKPKED